MFLQWKDGSLCGVLGTDNDGTNPQRSQAGLGVLCPTAACRWLPLIGVLPASAPHFCLQRLSRIPYPYPLSLIRVPFSFFFSQSVPKVFLIPGGRVQGVLFFVLLETLS